VCSSHICVLLDITAYRMVQERHFLDPHANYLKNFLDHAVLTKYVHQKSFSTQCFSPSYPILKKGILIISHQNGKTVSIESSAKIEKKKSFIPHTIIDHLYK